MGKDHIEAYLTHLAVDKNVSPTTQNQAFNAILFPYKEVLGIDTSEWNIQALRAKRKEHLPVVLTKEEVREIIFPDERRIPVDAIASLCAKPQSGESQKPS